MQSAGTESSWLHYPMGPNVRRLLDVKESQYRGSTNPHPDAIVSAAFLERLREAVAQESLLDHIEQLLDLLEELVSMGLGDMALKLADTHRRLQPTNHLRGMLTLAAAAMLDEKLTLAETLLREAQTLAPDELSIYVNISQIFFHQQRDEEAVEWATAGLAIDANHRRLWETIATCLQEANAENAAREIQKIADEHTSWAGASIAAMIEDPDDPLLRVQRLEDCYRNGVTDPQFLVEYTGALGAAQQFAKIPAIIWRAEQQSSSKLPWQLYAHAAQAQLALNKTPEFDEWMQKAMRHGDMPAHARDELNALAAEVAQELFESSSAPTTTHTH